LAYGGLVASPGKVDAPFDGVVLPAETRGGDVTTGVVGIVGTAALVVVVTSGVGTIAAELTPRFPISTEPKGTPTRGAPLGVVGAVGVEEAVMLLEPEPHMLNMPAVSMIPEAVDMPELCNIPDVVDSEGDMLGVAAVFPAAPPAAGTDAVTDMPPPS
jgi:hypothetical protein